MNQLLIGHLRVSKADVSSVSPSSGRRASDKELTLETSTLETLYGGKFTLRSDKTRLSSATEGTCLEWNGSEPSLIIILLLIEE